MHKNITLPLFIRGVMIMMIFGALSCSDARQPPVAKKVAEGKARDFERTEILKAYGLEVLRFTNREIMENLNAVENIIFERLRKELI